VVNRVCKAGVHVTFNSKTLGLEKPGKLSDLRSVLKPTLCYQQKGKTLLKNVGLGQLFAQGI